ncbi:MAG: hypothetical protein ACE5J6_02645 [Candidatus Bathyarchaeia archaeon]
MDKNTQRSKSNAEKRLVKLGKITSEIMNSLAKQKVDGKTINVADIYFILSGALQQISFMNLVEIEEYKQKRQQPKIVI